jgi:hypothetical protein
MYSHYNTGACIWHWRLSNFYFLLNVTEDLRSQWTWKGCLHFAIEAMNDVGVEFFQASQHYLDDTGSLLAIGITSTRYQRLRQSVPASLLTIRMQRRHSRMMALLTSKTYGLK